MRCSMSFPRLGCQPQLHGVAPNNRASHTSVRLCSTAMCSPSSRVRWSGEAGRSRPTRTYARTRTRWSSSRRLESRTGISAAEAPPRRVWGSSACCHSTTCYLCSPLPSLLPRTSWRSRARAPPCSACSADSACSPRTWTSRSVPSRPWFLCHATLQPLLPAPPAQAASPPPRPAVSIALAQSQVRSQRLANVPAHLVLLEHEETGPAPGSHAQRPCALPLHSVALPLHSAAAWSRMHEHRAAIRRHLACHGSAQLHAHSPSARAVQLPPETRHACDEHGHVTRVFSHTSAEALRDCLGPVLVRALTSGLRFP